MSVSSVSTYQSIGNFIGSTGQTSSTGSETSETTINTQQDSIELSSAGKTKSGSNSSCIKGNTVCIGCGSCTSSVTNSVNGTTNADSAMLTALNAYACQDKLI